MLSTKTNLEITEYHEKFFLGLSLRQLACFGVAAVLAIASCFVCLQWLQLDVQLISYIVMVEVCILIHTYGDSNAQLDERVRRICSTVQQQTCRFDSILYEQRNAMNSMLPLGKKWLGLERTLETVSTAIYVPFTTQELFQPGGLYEGINARSKNLILCNRKLLPAPAGMVLGMTGYGKSFSVMQMVTNIMLRWPDDDIVLIDPEQEYTHLVTAMPDATSGGFLLDFCLYRYKIKPFIHHFSPLMAVVCPSETPSVLSGINRIFTVANMIFKSSTMLG